MGPLLKQMPGAFSVPLSINVRSLSLFSSGPPVIFLIKSFLIKFTVACDNTLSWLTVLRSSFPRGQGTYQKTFCLTNLLGIALKVSSVR